MRWMRCAKRPRVGARAFDFDTAVDHAEARSARRSSEKFGENLIDTPYPDCFAVTLNLLRVLRASA